VPTYRRRLRLEGLALAGCGLVSALSVLAFGAGSTDDPVSTALQLLAVAVVMSTAGTLSVRRSIAGAAELPVDAAGDGQPTALWKLPLIVAALTLGFGLFAGWAAGLRIGGGCVIVGLAQAVLFERVVAAEEARRDRRYFRVPGSRILATQLGSRPVARGPARSWIRSR
jgi:hypothetical protein